MDREKYLILINGQDKTDSVKEFRPCGDSCDIIYTSSSQVYHYQGGKVKILELQQRVDPAGLIVTVKGIRVTQVDMIFRFWSILSSCPQREENTFLSQRRSGDPAQLLDRRQLKMYFRLF